MVATAETRVDIVRLVNSLLVSAGVHASCALYWLSVELVTKVHPKIRNHGEGPY